MFISYWSCLIKKKRIKEQVSLILNLQKGKNVKPGHEESLLLSHYFKQDLQALCTYSCIFSLIVCLVDHRSVVIKMQITLGFRGFVDRFLAHAPKEVISLSWFSSHCVGKLCVFRRFVMFFSHRHYLYVVISGVF